MLTKLFCLLFKMIDSLFYANRLTLINGDTLTGVPKSAIIVLVFENPLDKLEKLCRTNPHKKITND